LVPEAHPWPRSSRTTALGALAQRFDGLRQHILAIEAGRLEDYVSVANVEAFWMIFMDQWILGLLGVTVNG